MSKTLVDRITAPYQEIAREYRHYLHQNPELSFQEYKTSAYVKEKLASFGVPMRENFSGTSVLAEIDSGKPGPVILFRAELDALPVQEETDNPFASKIPGVMHACGHDIHTALLLAFAKLLSEHRELVGAGKIRFAFQSAEELIPGGAKTMVEEGAAQGVDYAFGFHIMPSVHTGTIAMSEGFASAAIGTFGVTLRGKGGHTAMPHRSHNPLSALCDIADSIERLTARALDPMHTAVVCMSYLNAGGNEFPNIIPDSGELGGSIRCSHTEDRDKIYEEIERIVQSVCAQYECEYEIDAKPGYPATMNSDICCKIVWNAADELGLSTLKRRGGLGGEDFSYFTLACPSAWFLCGAGDPDKPETLFPNHNPHFNPDEKGMDHALRMLLEVYLQALNS